MQRSTTPQRTLTDKVDAILIHKVWGLVTFAVIMATLFVSIFFLADPIMGGVEDGIGWLGGKVANLMSDGPLKDLWTDGIVRRRRRRARLRPADRAAVLLPRDPRRLRLPRAGRVL
jgi:Fe2+ transport system protein B